MIILPPPPSTSHPTLSIGKYPIRNENPAEIDPWEAREMRRGSLVLYGIAKESK
jgi:hypothetical protein